MELKKILAFAMLVLLALPSLTMVVRADEPDDPEDGAGMADAIDRARLYLDNIRTSAETLAGEYKDNVMIQGYLNDINELLDQDWEDGPESHLQAGTNGIAERSNVQPHTGTYSAHLDSNDVSPGDEARIVIPMPSGFTLGDLDTLSWWVNTIAGYPPHVDITLETTDPLQSMLTAELAVNNPSYSPPTYGTYDTWLETFEMDLDDGYGVIDDDTVFWVTKMGAGDLDAPSSTLAQWKAGVVGVDPGSELTTTEIDLDTPVLKLEIEVDNWIVESEAYIDDIKVDGVTYDFEEEPEGLGAEGFLDQASAYLAEDEFNLAARSLAAARNILGRVKGLLNSMMKIHRVNRTEKFIQQFEHRIEALEDKIDRLRVRFGVVNANKANAAMGLAKGKLNQLGADVSEDNVDETLDGLDDIIEDINVAIEDLDGDTSNILEAMDRLEAKIRVLKASSERLAKKGSDTSDVDAELDSVELILNDAMDSLAEGDTETAENLLEQADEIVSEASKNIQRIRTQNKGKGNKDSKPKKNNHGEH